MKQKEINMQAFASVDFDCEFFDKIKAFDKSKPIKTIGTLQKRSAPPLDQHKHLSNMGFEYEYCLPRMNKAQVLDNGEYSKVLIKGLVWDFKRFHPLTKRVKVFTKVTSKQVKQLSSDANIQWLKCIGVEPEYAEWGRERGMDVVEL